MSVATYILDSGFLVDLALQVLENALSEKGVGRHDVWFVSVLCVVDYAFLGLFNWWLKSTCRKFDGRHVKFAREPRRCLSQNEQYSNAVFSRNSQPVCVER